MCTPIQLHAIQYIYVHIHTLKEKLIADPRVKSVSHRFHGFGVNIWITLYLLRLCQWFAK